MPQQCGQLLQIHGRISLWHTVVFVSRLVDLCRRRRTARDGTDADGRDEWVFASNSCVSHESSVCVRATLSYRIMSEERYGIRFYSYPG